MQPQQPAARAPYRRVLARARAADRDLCVDLFGVKLVLETTAAQQFPADSSRRLRGRDLEHHRVHPDDVEPSSGSNAGSYPVDQLL